MKEPRNMFRTKLENPTMRPLMPNLRVVIVGSLVVAGLSFQMFIWHWTYIAILVLLADLFLGGFFLAAYGNYFPSTRGKIRLYSTPDGIVFPGRRGRMLLFLLPGFPLFIGVPLYAEQSQTGRSMLGSHLYREYGFLGVIIPILGAAYLIYIMKSLILVDKDCHVKIGYEGVSASNAYIKCFWSWENVPSPEWGRTVLGRMLTSEQNDLFPELALRSDPRLIAELIEFYRSHSELRSELRDHRVIERIGNNAFRIENANVMNKRITE